MMHVDAEKVARRVHAWHRAGMPCWWITVLSTFGASSAPPGSALAVSEAEAWVGSIGMPNIDQAAVRRVLSTSPGEPAIWSFGSQPDAARALGMPVGADPVVVRVEPVTESNAEGFAEMASMLRERRSVVRSSSSGEVRAAIHLSGDAPVDPDVVVHHPPWRLVMTSATPLAVELCERAASLGFECLVIEPREAYRAVWPKTASLAHCRLSDGTVADVMRPMPLDARTAVLALAHDPSLDDPLLGAALGSEVFLLGALGSRANHAARLKRLAAEGAGSAELEAIKGPVGLDIGSHTPAEIAVAILAQLIERRNAAA